MKNSMHPLQTTKTLLPLLLFLLSLNLPLQAQDQPQEVYAMATCLKIKAPGFKDLIKEAVLPFNTTLVKQGKEVDWVLYQTVYPSNDDCKCDYYMVDIFTDFDQIDFFNDDANFFKVAADIFSEEQMKTLPKRWEETVEMKGSRIYRMIDELVAGPVPSRYISMNYMNVAPGKGRQYVKMEKEIFKPIHQASKAAGQLKDWVLMRRILPYGSDWDGNYITIDFWGEWANLNQQLPDGTVKKIHPDQSMDAIFNQISGIRELARSEVLKYVTSVSEEMAKAKQGQ